MDNKSLIKELLQSIWILKSCIACNSEPSDDEDTGIRSAISQARKILEEETSKEMK